MLEVKDNKSARSKLQMDMDSWGNYSAEKRMRANRKNRKIMNLKENYTWHKKLICIRSNDQEPNWREYVDKLKKKKQHSKVKDRIKDLITLQSPDIKQMIKKEKL